MEDLDWDSWLNVQQQEAETFPWRFMLRMNKTVSIGTYSPVRIILREKLF